jgi:predicted transcriptional regulator
VGDEFSKYEKIRVLVQRHFPIVWFSSKEVQLAYEQELKEPVSLSTVATYLARLTNKGFLIKAGASNRLKYKLSTASPQVALKQQTP